MKYYSTNKQAPDARDVYKRQVFGGTDSEELQLNEETVWGGGPHRNDNPEALQALPQIRQLVFEDVYKRQIIS